MRIKHIKLKNWKNFRDVDVNLEDNVYVVGPNASGKSNFLDVFRFLHDIAKQGGSLYSAIDSRGGISKIRCLAARTHPEIEISVNLQDTSTKTEWKYCLGIKQEPTGLHNPHIYYEKAYHGEQLIFERPVDKDKKDPKRLYQTYLENVNENKDFREIVDFFATIRYLHLVPQLVRFPQYFSGKKMPEDPYGQNFLELLAKTTENVRQSRLKKIEKSLKMAVPQLHELSFIRDEAGHPHLEAIYSHWRPKAGKQREDQFSDGTLRLIGIFWAVLETKDSLLLMEEPELSLHPAIIEKLPKMFYKMKRGQKKVIQIFISTHSYDLLSDHSIAAEEVLLLSPSNEGTVITVASSDKEIKNLLASGMSIGDVVIPKSATKEMQLSLWEYV